MIQTKTRKQSLDIFKANDTYLAGFPSYARNFSRDALWAGIIANDEDLIESQLIFSSINQGTKFDYLTGEEPGKIHHEFPGVSLREPFLTTYNACDTTALFLVALDGLRQLNEQKFAAFMASHPDVVEKAATYLRSHIKNEIFWEYPPADADRYSLRVTYWKDSVIPLNHSVEPVYPVCYALVQFMAANALAIAAEILNQSELSDLSAGMYLTGIKTFIKEESFCVFKDRQNIVRQPSSDELHCLRYIPAAYAPLLPIESILKRARDLYTPAGIACTPKSIADMVDDNYHGYVVWPFEQALIHQACDMFGLSYPASVATRCATFIKNGTELIDFTPEPVPAGNDQQLWSVAADIYFESMGHGT